MKTEHTPQWKSPTATLLRAERDRLKAANAEMLEALKNAVAANDAILVVVRDAYDRFTDNDMMPPNSKLKNWLASAEVCLQQGNVEKARAAIAKAEAL